MKFEILEKTRIFNEFFRIDRVKLKIEKFRNNNWGRIRRYHINRPGAVAVLLENTSTGTIILVEQFRYASLKKTVHNGWTREIVAGLIDSGETPEDSARREVFHYRPAVAGFEKTWTTPFLKSL
ncbi:MAG: NUDIX hydrolase [Proteobacteria bacterium]|nr:NUDIX hydrolase [Pseudomonadota bacterium]